MKNTFKPVNHEVLMNILAEMAYQIAQTPGLPKNWLENIDDIIFEKLFIEDLTPGKAGTQTPKGRKAKTKK